MKRLLLAGCVVLAAPLLCAAAPPSDESLLTLFRVMKAEAQLEDARNRLEQSLQQAIGQASAGKPLTEEQEVVVKEAPRRLAALLRAEMSWQKQLPAQMAIYRDSFDQEDIDGLIAFYASPVGRRVVDKMPRVTQNVMLAMQEQLRTAVPLLQAEMRRILVDAKLAD